MKLANDYHRPDNLTQCVSCLSTIGKNGASIIALPDPIPEIGNNVYLCSTDCMAEYGKNLKQTIPKLVLLDGSRCPYHGTSYGIFSSTDDRTDWICLTRKCEKTIPRIIPRKSTIGRF